MRDVEHNKVLVVLYYYEPYVSGVSVCAKRVAEGLVKAGYKVTVLTTRYDKALAKKEVINGVEVIRRPVLAKLNKGVVAPTFWLDMALLARHYDYVNPQLPMADSGLASLFIPKRKIVTTYQCDLNLGSGVVDRLIAKLSMALMRLQLQRSRVVVPSSEDYLLHSQMKDFMPKAVAIQPMVTTYEFTHVNSEPWLKRLKISPKTVKIGFLGRLVEEKGISYLLESIPYLAEALPDFKIIIGGDYEKVAGGGIKDQLDHFKDKYPDKVIFTGFLSIPDRLMFFSALDAFILPSVDPLDAYGMVQVEAMLCGAPVVASNMPGVRQIVKQVGYGRIAKVADPKDIAKQIIEVVTHPDQYRPKRSVVNKTFDSQKAVKAYMRLMPKN